MTAPPPGCVEQRLSALGALQPADRQHDELQIPRGPPAPYGLQLLLDVFRDQYLAFIRRMAEPDYAANVRQQIDKEKVSLHVFCLPSLRHKSRRLCCRIASRLMAKI